MGNPANTRPLVGVVIPPDRSHPPGNRCSLPIMTLHYVRADPNRSLLTATRRGIPLVSLPTGPTPTTPTALSRPRPSTVFLTLDANANHSLPTTTLRDIRFTCAQPPKTLKFKPLVSQAQEPSKMSRRAPPPAMVAGVKSTPSVAPRSAAPRTTATAAAAEGTAVTRTAAAAPREGDAKSAGSVADAGVAIGGAVGGLTVNTDASFTGGRCQVVSSEGGRGADVCFKNLQVEGIEGAVGLLAACSFKNRPVVGTIHLKVE